MISLITLTNEARWNDKADLILANPPFMTPKGGVTPHNRFSIASRRTEVLFLDYILEHLTSSGRAGVIVPEGIMFVDQRAQERLRKMLIEENMLIAAVSLPNGVFKPYASVKTHILFVDKVLATRTDKVLFLEVESDGFTQTDTRLASSRNCLPSARQTVLDMRHALQEGKALPVVSNGIRGYYVSKPQIRKSERTHLIGRWYDLPNRLPRREGLRYVSLEKLCEIHDGLSPNMATLPGPYPLVVPAEDRKTADHFDYDAKAVCIPLVSASGHGKADMKRIHYQEGCFALADTMCCLVSRDEDELNPKFLYYMLDEIRDEILVPLMAGATNVTMKSSQLAQVEVPVPTPTEQLRIVRRIELLHYAERTEGLLREMSTNPALALSKAELNHLEALATSLRKDAAPLPTLREALGLDGLFAKTNQIACEGEQAA
jgi:hypothetical protein